MRKYTGDIWDFQNHYIVIPVNLEGVMGRGLAKQVAQRWPHLATALREEGRKGVTLRSYHAPERVFLNFYVPELAERSTGEYQEGPGGNPPPPVMNPYPQPYYRLVMFPVKRCWRDEADLSMIRRSLVMLSNLLTQYQVTPCAIPLVGCGYGELRPEVVIPVIEEHLNHFGDRCVLVQPGTDLRGKYPEAFKPGIRTDKTAIEAN